MDQECVEERSESSAGRPAARVPWRRILIRVAGGLALVLVGGAASYLLVPPKVTEVSEVVAPPTVGDADVTATAPSVVGLTEDVARRAIADAGITRGVEVKTEPAAGRPGRVLRQNPEVGQRTTRMTLTLSEGAEMPNLLGQDVDSARTLLQELGAAVVVHHKIAADKAARSVLSTSPRPGRALPEQVILVIAHPGDSVFLSDVTSADTNGCQPARTARVADTDLLKSWTCRSSSSTPASVTFDLEDRAQLLTARVGVSDQTKGDATLEVIGDGKPIGHLKLKSETLDRLTVDVSGVNQLVLKVTSPATARVIIGEAALLGDSAALATLTDR